MNAINFEEGDAPEYWLTVCEFCVKEAEVKIASMTDELPICPHCGATFIDRTLVVSLIATFSEVGDLRFSKFVTEKKSIGLKFGSIGKVFSDIRHTAKLIDYPFRYDLRDLSWREPEGAISRRIPLTDHLLDALLVGSGEMADDVLDEALRVLRQGGVLLMPVRDMTEDSGHTADPDVNRLRAAGFHVHFVLPRASHGNSRHGALLLAVRPSSLD